jgi:hypothetical protein
MVKQNSKYIGSAGNSLDLNPRLGLIFHLFNRFKAGLH